MLKENSAPKNCNKLEIIKHFQLLMPYYAGCVTKSAENQRLFAPSREGGT
jgi:hypothetical protein